VSDIFEGDPQAGEWRTWAKENRVLAEEAFRLCQKWQNVLKGRADMDADTEFIEMPKSIQEKKNENPP